MGNEVYPVPTLEHMDRVHRLRYKPGQLVANPPRPIDDDFLRRKHHHDHLWMAERKDQTVIVWHAENDCG